MAACFLKTVLRFQHGVHTDTNELIVKIFRYN